MRILHVIRGLANSSGTTHIVGPLAEAQAKEGNRVRILFVEKRGRIPVTPDPTWVDSTEFPLTVNTNQFGWSYALAQALPRIVRDADVVHIHAIWNFPTWWAMRTAYLAGVPYVVAPQGSLEHWALDRSRHLKTAYAWWAEKRYYDRAAVIQALTDSEVNQCREFGIRAPIALLPNGVSLSAIESGEDTIDLHGDLGIDRESIVILFLSRIFPKKGLDLLIPAFGRLVRQGRKACLLVAGDDAGTGYRTEVESLVRREGVAERVRFLGEVQGRRKFQMLRSADLFVLTSRSEGLPVAVLEALGCGCPVVITDRCNLPEVETHQAGWTVAATVADIAQGLVDASTDGIERRRRGANGHQLVMQRFTWSKIAAESIQLYERLRGGASTSVSTISHAATAR